MSEKTTTQSGIAVSHLDIGGDWETRKISVMGTLSSFITSLRIGDEITKISLPSVLLSPYSALELAGSRGLSYIDLLLRANKETDAFQRFLCVVRWYLGYTQKEKLKRKPYNPIIGENHICWVTGEITDSENPLLNTTKFFAEQTSHHPPVTAFIIHNEAENVLVSANLGFSTKFYGNSAGVIATGVTHVDLLNHKEHYTISKSMPDLSIRNMVLGTKRISWEGDVTITCESSGYVAHLHYKEEGRSSTNVVNGYICTVSDPKTKLFKIEGPCGEVIKLKEGKKEEVILDCSTLKKNKLNYMPWEKLDELSSFKVWEELSKAIVADDMYKADVAKREVEDAQRKRRNEGHSFEAKFFVHESHHSFWNFKKEKLPDIDKMILSCI